MGRMGISVPYYHGQDGQDGQFGAMSLWAERAARCHITMGSPVPYRHEQNRQFRQSWLAQTVQAVLISSDSPGLLRQSWLVQTVLACLGRCLGRRLCEGDCFILDAKSLFYAKATVLCSMRKAYSMRKTWL